MLECNGKIVLSFVITTDMIDETQTVHADDWTDCTARVKNKTDYGYNIWHVNYSIFIGDRVDNNWKNQQLEDSSNQ